MEKRLAPLCTRVLSLSLLGLIAAPASAAIIYWDVSGFVPGSGGPSPSGTWDTTAPNWNDSAEGTGNAVVWQPGDTAIFSAGDDANGDYTVTLVGLLDTPQMIVKNGTLSLTGGSFSGHTVSVGSGNISVVQGATLSIDNSTRVAGTSGAGATLTLDGGTMKQTNSGNAGSFLPATLTLQIGAGGGTVNYTSSGTGAVSIYSGTITGPGVLTKTGPNEFRYQGTGLPNTTFSKLVVAEGLYRLGFNSDIQDERGFGAVPATFTPDAITLSGGGSIATSFNSNFSVLHENRGITLGPGGGAIVSVMTVPGAMTGTGGLTTTANGVNLNGLNTFTGGINVNAGTTTVGASGGLQAQDVTTLGSAVLAVNGNISGAGTLRKLGDGTLRMAGTNTYTGGTEINAGTLSLTGTISGTASVDIRGTLTGNGTITVANDGNVNYRVGGKIQPGVTTGTLTFNLGGSGMFDLIEGTLGTDTEGLIFDLASPGASDRVVINGGALEISVGLLEINDFKFNLLAGFSEGDYVLFETDEAISGLLGPSVIGIFGEFEGELRISDDGTDIILSVVPEPASAMLLLGGCALLAGGRRRRQATSRATV